MKKIAWIFVLLILLFAGDRLGGWILGKLTVSSQFRYSRMYQGAAASDILLVGNSRGLIFYQPYIEEITGQKTFNLSFNGMPINLARTLVKDYLDKYPAPKTMLLEITMADRENEKLINDFKLFTPYSENMESLLYDQDPTFVNAAKFSHLFRYNSQIFHRSLYHLNKTDTDWLLDRVITKYKEESVKDIEPYLIDVDAKRIAEIKATVELAQAKGVQVHLVINPYYPAFAKKITNIEQLKSDIQKASGLGVYDYSQSVTDSKYFADFQHLNVGGAKAFIDLMQKDQLFFGK